MAGGRPFALKDLKKRKRLIDAFKLGSTIKMACGYAGVSEAMFFKLKAAVAAGKGAKWQRELMDEVNSAVEDGNVNALAHIRAAMKKNWQAAAWMLERRMPQEYGRPWRQDQSTGGESDAMSGVLVAPTASTPSTWIAEQAKSNAKAKEPDAEGGKRRQQKSPGAKTSR